MTLLQRARAIWGPPPVYTGVHEVVARMGVIFGDICRWSRGQNERRDEDLSELKKELGNMVLSTVRWIDDLGFDVEECIRLAEDSQREYLVRYR